MLVFQRSKNQEIVIAAGTPDQVVITVVELRDGKVRIGVTAPNQTTVHRGEVWEAIHPDKPLHEPAPF